MVGWTALGFEQTLHQRKEGRSNICTLLYIIVKYIFIYLYNIQVLTCSMGSYVGFEQTLHQRKEGRSKRIPAARPRPRLMHSLNLEIQIVYFDYQYKCNLSIWKYKKYSEYQHKFNLSIWKYK